MKRLTSTILTALIAASTVIAVAPNADAACRWASDYDTAGRRCGKRSAEVRGPTTGYDRSGGGGGYVRSAAQDAIDTAKVKRINAQMDKDMAVKAAKAAAEDRARKQRSAAEVAAWQARSKADAAAWADNLCAELNLKVCR